MKTIIYHYFGKKVIIVTYTGSIITGVIEEEPNEVVLFKMAELRRDNFSVTCYSLREEIKNIETIALYTLIPE